jgi:hypothetical protein
LVKTSLTIENGTIFANLRVSLHYIRIFRQCVEILVGIILVFTAIYSHKEQLRLRLLLLVLAAPAFNFQFVENFAHDAAEQAFEVGVLDVLQTTHGLFFVAFQ